MTETTKKLPTKEFRKRYIELSEAFEAEAEASTDVSLTPNFFDALEALDKLVLNQYPLHKATQKKYQRLKKEFEIAENDGSDREKVHQLMCEISNIENQIENRLQEKSIELSKELNL